MRPDGPVQHPVPAAALIGHGPALQSFRHAILHRARAGERTNARRCPGGHPGHHPQPVGSVARAGPPVPLYDPPRLPRCPGFGAAHSTVLPRADPKADFRRHGSQSLAPPPGAQHHGTAHRCETAQHHAAPRCAAHHYAAPRHGAPRHAIQHHPLPRHPLPRSALPRRAAPGYAIPHRAFPRHAARCLLIDVPSSLPRQHHARDQTPFAPHPAVRQQRRHAQRSSAQFRHRQPCHLSAHQHAQSRRHHADYPNQSAPEPCPAFASQIRPRTHVARGSRHGVQASLPPRSPPPLAVASPQPTQRAPKTRVARQRTTTGTQQ